MNNEIPNIVHSDIFLKDEYKNQMIYGYDDKLSKQTLNNLDMNRYSELQFEIRYVTLEINDLQISFGLQGRDSVVCH